MNAFPRSWFRRLAVPALLCAAGLPAITTLASDPAVNASSGATSSAGPNTLTDTLGEAVVGRASSTAYAIDNGFHSTLNLPPLTVQDAMFATATGGKIPLATLLANDRDPDLEPVTLVSAATVSNEGGTVRLQEGWLFYTAPAAWNGTDLVTYTVADTAGNHVAGTLAIQSGTGAPAAPRTIVRIQALPGGQRALRFVGIAGRSYSIQIKNDLSEPSWTEVAVLTAAPNGLFDYTDTETPLPSQRYYRAMSRQEP
jgi:hypothetical protein